jgi:hypothetical protein
MALLRDDFLQHGGVCPTGNQRTKTIGAARISFSQAAGKSV